MGSIIPGLGTLTSLASGQQQSASNAQSGVRQYDPSQNWSGFNQGQGKASFDARALLDAQNATSTWAASPGDVSPTGGNMFAGGDMNTGGGMGDGGFGDSGFG